MSKDSVESQLMDYIKDAEEQQKELRRKKESIDSDLAILSNRIKNLKQTLNFHLERTGKVPKGRFSNIKSLGEACEKIIKEHDEISPQEILEELEDGGFNMKSNKKTQAIFFSVFKNPNIERNEKGNYKWVGSKEGE